MCSGLSHNIKQMYALEVDPTARKKSHLSCTKRKAVYVNVSSGICMSHASLTYACVSAYAVL